MSSQPTSAKALPGTASEAYSADPAADSAGPAADPAGLAAAASVFEALRPRLFGIAYRMLGSVSEAEDVLQEGWVRWQNYDRRSVRNPEAFLTTTITRIAINVAQSARVQRTSYIGPWLPEPVDTSADPALGAETGEALEMAVLMLLEKLSPTERAAYVLREAFDYPYSQIADIISESQVNVRQLVSRARKHLASEKRNAVTAAEQRRLLDAFLVAAQAGDLVQLERLLAQDVISLSDGGGAVRAAKFPVVGRERVAKFIRAFASHFWAGVTAEVLQANGQVSALLSRDGLPYAVVTVIASSDGIDRVLWLMNPHKLVNLVA